MTLFEFYFGWILAFRAEFKKTRSARKWFFPFALGRAAIPPDPPGPKRRSLFGKKQGIAVGVGGSSSPSRSTLGSSSARSMVKSEPSKLDSVGCVLGKVVHGICKVCCGAGPTPFFPSETCFDVQWGSKKALNVVGQQVQEVACLISSSISRCT